jgi:hypothetical protein
MVQLNCAVGRLLRRRYLTSISSLALRRAYYT